MKQLITTSTQPNPVAFVGLDRGYIHALNVELEQGVPAEDTLARAEELDRMRHAMGEVSADITARQADESDPFLTFMKKMHEVPKPSPHNSISDK